MVCILILIIVALVAYLIYKGTKKPQKFPPGPPRLPIIGSLPFIATKSKPSEPRSLLTGIREGTTTLSLRSIFHKFCVTFMFINL